MSENGFDSILVYIGGFGKFQTLILIYASAISILSGMCDFGYILTTAKLKHRCLIEECEKTDAQWSDDPPWISSAFPPESDSCLRYEYSSSNTTISCASEFFKQQMYPCDSFVYETPEWTIAREEWGPHCDSDRYMLALIGSLSNAGQALGGLFNGYLFDRYGRRTVIALTLGVMSAGVIKSFSVNYAMMASLETVEAIMGASLFSGSFIICSECVDPSRRVLVTAIISAMYTVGEVIIGFAQYFTFHWRYTLLFCYSPFIFAISFCWLISESARWLLDNRKYARAMDVLQKIAKTNRRTIPEEMVQRIVANGVSASKERCHTNGLKEDTIEIWKSKIVRRRVMACLLVWVCNTFVYFGISLNSVSISENKFLNFILTALIEFPAYGISYFLLSRIGRRWSHSGSLFICGFACIAAAYIPDDSSWTTVKLLLYLVGKLGTSVAAYVLNMMTAEMFPTSIRSTMMNAGTMVGRLFSTLAPQVPLLEDLYKPLPLLVFGGMSTLSAILSFAFPETLNCKLPDTTDEAENLGQENSL